MARRKRKIHDPPPREPTLEQHMIEFGKVTAASLNSAINPNKKYLILQGNKTAQIFIKNAFEFFEKHFPNKNPHTLTARCLQINVSAVRRFKKGPTEKTISQRPCSKKTKSEDSIPKTKEPKSKKSTNSNKSSSKPTTIENDTPNSNKLASVQENINYQPTKVGISDSYVPQTKIENRDYDSLQVPLFPLTPQNAVYPYSSGKNMDFQDQNRTLNSLPKPLVSDIFHLSPEPQYGAPSVAVATGITHKTNLPDPTQSSTVPFQPIKQFNNPHSGYQFPHSNMPIKNDSETKNQASKDVQNQYDQSKFSYGNIQSNQTGYKY